LGERCDELIWNGRAFAFADPWILPEVLILWGVRSTLRNVTSTIHDPRTSLMRGFTSNLGHVADAAR
jgi:hypothetical protein